MARKYTFSPGGREARARDGLGRMDSWQKQQVFRTMAIHQLRQGRLSAGRRRRIVQYATILGFNAVQAGRLLQEAQRLFEQECEEQGTTFPRIHTGNDDESDGAQHGNTKAWWQSGKDAPHGGSESSSWRKLLAFVLGGVLVNSWLITKIFS